MFSLLSYLVSRHEETPASFTVVREGEMESMFTSMMLGA